MQETEGQSGGKVPTRKTFKLSDLPVAASTNAAIDSLVSTFKKQGEFDRLRKQIWAQFDTSVRLEDSRMCMYSFSDVSVIYRRPNRISRPVSSMSLSQ
jgi:COMPASS (Complex proteins associated with Set1p) component shg1